MHYQVRPMCKEDIPQAIKLDRQAFPTQWPTTSYRRELENKMAHYLVVCDSQEEKQSPALEEPSQPEEKAQQPRGLVSWVKRLFAKERFFPPENPSAEGQPILGMVGFWLMFDEAHITTIAVWEHLQRQGLGELLLISTIDRAMEMGAQVVTLEVRVSNTAAQALYEKYGFKNVGARRGYYTDNREDAAIMTTDQLSSASFQSQFQRLKQECMERLERRL
ncbi:MAG: ribosomal protein S18-alanine N-acetyltransferase [Dehalococcoidia bacterium]